MIEQLKTMITRLDEEIVHAELNDLAYTVDYYRMWKQLKVLLKALKKLERI